MSDATVDFAKDAKQRLQETINKEITKFQFDTGMDISEIILSRIDTMCSQSPHIVVKVIATI